jgi:hypothetical protein
MREHTVGTSGSTARAWLPVFGLAAWLGAAISTSPLPAQTIKYCAFEITVKSPEGVPVPGISVSASSEGARPFARVVSNEEGVARICDSPVSSNVSISAGSGGCGEVTVRNLYPLWLQTRRVYVTVQTCLQPENLFAHECRFVVRVRDIRNVPLPGVRLVAVDSAHGGGDTAISDRFGRIFTVVPLHRAFAGTLEKENYVPGEVTLECGPRSAHEDEKTIVLNSARPH